MDWLCLIGLIYLFGRCKGRLNMFNKLNSSFESTSANDTHSVFFFISIGNFLMIYKEKEEAILLSCKRDGWQMDLDQDNTIDCYSNATKNILECENGPSKLKKVTSGFFACVYLSAEEQTPPWLFPFKPKHQVDFYIVALIEPNCEFKH